MYDIYIKSLHKAEISHIIFENGLVLQILMGLWQHIFGYGQHSFALLTNATQFCHTYIDIRLYHGRG